MDRKLIVEVLRVRDAGRIIPRYQHALGNQPRGILTLQECQVPWLNRHVRIATLLEPETGRPAAGIYPLLDAAMLRATADEWVFTGFERVTLPTDQEIHCVQTWIVRAIALSDREC